MKAISRMSVLSLIFHGVLAGIAAYIIAYFVAGLLIGTAFGDDCQCSPASMHAVHADHLPTGASPANPTFIGHHYVASHDTETKVATWVAYRVTDAEASSRNQLGRNWLHGYSEFTLEAPDFSQSDYDMGHLVALASFSGSRYAHELNFTGIVAPQTPSLNRGPWLQLENLVREIAEDLESIGVICGPLYEREMPTLPAADEPHRVPSHYWAIITPSGGDQLAWIVPQDCGRTDRLEQFEATVDEVARRSGLQFDGEPAAACRCEK